MRQVKQALGRRSLLAMVALAAMIAPGQTQPPAAETTEIRDFTILVDGKQAGNSQLVIVQRKDGTTQVSAKANVQVKLFLTYTYSFQGTEVWKDGQLQKLTGQCSDNGTKHNVQADLDAKKNQILVKADGKEQWTGPEVWTTSYWKLPPEKFFNKAVTLVDADRGDVIAGNLQYVGTENRVVAGKEQKCYQFKSVGPNPSVDLWFDVYHRLVRQEFTDRGHRTVIELVNVQR